MKRILPIGTFVLATVSAGMASASSDKRCSVPMAEWQPVAALQQKLQNDGWRVNSIKTDDDCYEVYATDDKGRRIEAYFNPKTFETVKKKVED